MKDSLSRSDLMGLLQPVGGEGVEQVGPQDFCAELSLSLEYLKELTGAASVRLVRWAGGDPCACRPLPGREGATVCLSRQCQRSLDGVLETLAQWEYGAEAAAIACARCGLSTGDSVALLLGLPYYTADVAQLFRTFLPVLFWARERLERRALEVRLAALEERSRSLWLLALKAQEEEREWLAYEVHDRVGQTLAAAFHQLQTIEAMSEALPQIRKVALRGSGLVREALQEARTIMNDLRPPMLDELGLVPLVEEELRRLEKDVGCQVAPRLVFQARPPRDVELALYRIFHEALINIRRHSGATRVGVSLECLSREVRLQVEDNGGGFDVASALAGKRVGGLMSMKRRAELLGGSCYLCSGREEGTRVSVTIPLEALENL